MDNSKSISRKTCWNKGKLVGQKRPLKLEEKYGQSRYDQSWQITCEN